MFSEKCARFGNRSFRAVFRHRAFLPTQFPLFPGEGCRQWAVGRVDPDNVPYCPYVTGCRGIGTSQFREGMSESIYIGRQNNILVSIVIPGDKEVWIVSSLVISFCFQFSVGSH